MNRGRRASPQGLQSTVTRMRGGFQASMVPRASGSTSTDGNTCSTNSYGNQMIVIGTSGSFVNQSQQRDECDDSDSGDINAAVASILNLSRNLVDQMNRIEKKMVGLENKQDGLSQTLKDISDLIKGLKKDSFSIKGSPYEV